MRGVSARGLNRGSGVGRVLKNEHWVSGGPPMSGLELSILALAIETAISSCRASLAYPQCEIPSRHLVVGLVTPLFRLTQHGTDQLPQYPGTEAVWYIFKLQEGF